MLGHFHRLAFIYFRKGTCAGKSWHRSAISLLGGNQCQNPKFVSQFVQTWDNSQSDKQDIKNLFLSAVQSGTAPKNWARAVQPGAVHSNPLDIQLVLESLECLCFKLKELTYEDGLRGCIAVSEWPLPKTLACNYAEPIKLLVRKWLTTWRGCRWGEKQLWMELAFLDSRQR